MSASHTFRFVLVCLALLGAGTISRGGITADTPYTDRGKADFDTALQLLNPYGSWSKIDEKWAFTPRDHLAPYTDGRWIYTEYGWYWKGNRPHSWLTEHYGYWKRGADKVWSWYPGPYWLPEIVEMRATATYVGWRSGEVDEDGNFVETALDRYSKPEEWTFVTLAQFANPITPETVAKPDVAESQLGDSTDCRHTYLTYREIDRPGPHPAELADLCQDGGMLAPKTLRDEAAVHAPTLAPAQQLATNATSALTNGTTKPTLPAAGIDPTPDTRQVKYWVTMSLPTFWSKPPADAKPGEIYLYRPDFYQDEDGIARRITLWFNPKARNTLSDLLGESMPGAPAPGATAPGTPASPAVPASGNNPFRSPFDESFHPATPIHPANSSSKSPAPVPTGLSAPDGAATNAAPATNSAPQTK